MDCIRVSQSLDDYLDGEIGRWRRQAVARHLDTCAACSSSFRFEVQVRQALWSKCRDEPPDGLRDRILRALESSALPLDNQGADSTAMPPTPPLQPPT